MPFYGCCKACRVMCYQCETAWSFVVVHVWTSQETRFQCNSSFHSRFYYSKIYWINLLYIFNLKKVLYLLLIECLQELCCVPLVLAFFKNNLGRMMSGSFFVSVRVCMCAFIWVKMRLRMCMHILCIFMSDRRKEKKPERVCMRPCLSVCGWACVCLWVWRSMGCVGALVSFCVCVCVCVHERVAWE
jgi:hypothetical protein